jgi:hypothetical protein
MSRISKEEKLDILYRRSEVLGCCMYRLRKSIRTLNNSILEKVVDKKLLKLLIDLIEEVEIYDECMGKIIEETIECKELCKDCSDKMYSNY